MNDYPVYPYTFRVQTRTAIVWMLWEETAWDAPALVSYQSDYDPAAQELKSLLETAIGFQGYQIENIGRNSPLEVYAALTSNGIIFDVVGEVPEVFPGSPEKDIEQDDTEDEEGEPVTESARLPKGLVIASTERVTDTVNAIEELNRAGATASTLQSFLDRMDGK